MGRNVAKTVLGGLYAVAFALAAVPALAALPAGTPPLPTGSPLPHVLPRAAPLVQPAAPAAPLPVTTEVPNRPVPVRRVVLEGVTAYTQAQLAPLLVGLTGPAVPLPRIEAAREALLRRYHDDGYVLSSVSASLGVKGTLRFLVTEGRIVSVKLSGDIGPAGTQVLRFLDRLTTVRPVTEAALERALLLAQSVPGVQMHAVLEPSAGRPGALNLIAEVQRKVVDGLVTTDNYASTYTGPYESLAVFDINSLTEFGDQTEISLYHTWPNTENFGQISEQIYLGGSGLRLKVYGGAGHSNPSGPLASEGYLGITQVYGARLSYPLIRARQQSLEIYTAFDAIDSMVSLETGGVRTRASSDALRVLRAGVDYARTDLLAGVNRGALNIADLSVSHGLPILGAARDGAADAPRTGERTDFFKVDFRLSRTQTLFSPWRNATVALMGLVTGQWSPDILPPAEEFYLGGFEYTRGYYAGEVSGDKGLAATGELQLNTPIDLHRLHLPEDVATQFFLFYDWGEVWQNQPLGLAMHVASIGGGVRVSITPRLEVDLLGLHRFNVYPTGTGASISALRGSAFYWRVMGRF